MYKSKEVERGAPEQLSYMNEPMALAELLTGNKTTEIRNLNTLAYKIKCKWKNQTKKAELRLERELKQMCL